MRMSETKRIIELALDTPQYPAIMLWGPPGIGKSQGVAQVAKARNIDIVDVRASLLDPTDLRGFPYLTDEKRMAWASPDFLPTDGKGILFLDELNLAPLAVQTACYQLILDRRIGKYRLPDGWIIVAAGNPKGIGVQRMPSALRKRMQHIHVNTDSVEWLQWAAANDIHPAVITYIKVKPQNLLVEESGGALSDELTPNPRAWEFISTALKASPRPLSLEEIEGFIAAEYAADFKGVLDMMAHGINPFEVLRNPRCVNIDGCTTIELYALLTGAVHISKPDNIGALLTFLDRLPEEMQALGEMLITGKPELRDTKEFIGWLCQHSGSTN